MTIPFRKTFTFAGHLDAVSSARETVMEFIEKHCSAGEDVFDILVAVQEALANAALHGCRNDESKLIVCQVSVRPDEVDIVVSDPGPGFDDARVADPKLLDTNYPESGRGISLMRGLMTEVTYRRRGSEVYLKKLLRAFHRTEDSLLNRIAV